MLRCTIPIPPSRAKAIAIRASVTVSIAAETTGTSSTIVRVSRVAVETSFGRTDDSAGTRRTSSKVSPSFANFAGRLVWAGSSPRFSTSIGEGYRGERMRSIELRGFARLEVRELDPGLQPPGLPRVEPPGAHLECRRGARRDGGAQGLLVRPARVPCGDVRREQHVAGADGRDGIDARRDGAEALDIRALLAQQRDASLLGRDDHVARPHLGDRVECE